MALYKFYRQCCHVTYNLLDKGELKKCIKVNESNIKLLHIKDNQFIFYLFYKY